MNKRPMQWTLCQEPMHMHSCTHTRVRLARMCGRTIGGGKKNGFLEVDWK